ncbi:multiheme c-type cytochrome [Methanolobus sp. WCC4]|uniref:multiheme c-type cytochrome n=1 Tax=Methanolobus sp. WCC4 TaxID=3125784 RepID=UPI0030FC2CE7
MKLKWYDRSSVVFIITFVIIMVLSVSANAENYVIGDQRSPVVMPVEGATYVGAEECSLCHAEKYAEWETTGHGYILITPEEALEMRADLPLPAGYMEDDILFVNGGWGWKARYIDEQGYIITKTGENMAVNGSNQYNIETGEWVDYNAGILLEYNCFKCHTTGASYDEGVEGLTGIPGSWEFRGVQCEACHGPGSEHVAQGGAEGVAINVDPSASFCGQCHRRGEDDDKIPSGGGFVQHHEEYQELLASGGMSTFDCVVCHDPHQPVHAGATNPTEGLGITTQCEDCHAEAARIYANSTKGAAGIECLDCHMPLSARSAVNTSPYVADVRSHLFRIDTSVDAEFTYIDEESGKEYANSYLTLEYACLKCHTDKDKAWAAETTPMVTAHAAKEDTAPMTSTEEATPGFGVITATLMIATGYLIVRRRP